MISVSRFLFFAGDVAQKKRQRVQKAHSNINFAHLLCKTKIINSSNFIKVEYQIYRTNSFSLSLEKGNNVTSPGRNKTC